jgi:hypothetical protein
MSDQPGYKDLSALGPRRTERWVTDSTAELATRDPAFAPKLARALLTTAASGEGPPAAHARDLLPHIPKRHVTLTSEHDARNDKLLDIWRRVYRSRIDWLFRGQYFLLAVEVKIRARTPFQLWQLDSYRRAIREQRVPYAGVLALTRAPPRKVDMLPARRRAALGYVLWEDVAPTLRHIAPHDPDDAAHWQAVIDAVMRPG